MQYNLLFSLSSLPNIVLPLFAGYFADLLGRRRMGIAYAIVVVVGQLFFTFGVSAKNIALCATGRLIYGYVTCLGDLIEGRIGSGAFVRECDQLTSGSCLIRDLDSLVFCQYRL